MLPRPYQVRLVENAYKRLKEKGNTLCIAATGAGKTICLSLLAGKFKGKKLILQHRDELVEQNMTKYRLVNPKVRPSLYISGTRSMAGDTVFAMAPTLARHLDAIPPLDLLILDEAHHVAAPTWQNIIYTAKEKNPNIVIAGFTATAERGDKKSLRFVFDNVADVVSIRELVGLGFLVPPKAYVLDVNGTQQKILETKTGSDYAEQGEIENILNNVAVNEEVLRHWKEKANGVQTVIFASTVKHAMDVANAFNECGIKAACVHGSMGKGERACTIRQFDEGRIKVLTNCMVLTEGFDSQPVGCVIILRKCSYKGTLIQMVGRGLRTVDPEKYPGVIKNECTVLDFGTSILTHGDLDSAAFLADELDKEELTEKVKTCPSEPDGKYKFPDKNRHKGCGAEVPSTERVCPICGFVFDRLKKEPVDSGMSFTDHVELTEMNLLEASPFRYVDLYGEGRAVMACGFESWAGVFSPDGDNWWAIARVKSDGPAKIIRQGKRLLCLSAADDFLRLNETDGSVKKSKTWLKKEATEKQVDILCRFGYPLERNSGSLDFDNTSGLTRYTASCHIEFQMNLRVIEMLLGV